MCLLFEVPYRAVTLYGRTAKRYIFCCFSEFELAQFSISGKFVIAVKSLNVFSWITILKQSRITGVVFVSF